MDRCNYRNIHNKKETYNVFTIYVGFFFVFFLTIQTETIWYLFTLRYVCFSLTAINHTSLILYRLSVHPPAICAHLPATFHYLNTLYDENVLLELLHDFSVSQNTWCHVSSMKITIGEKTTTNKSQNNN